MARNELLEVVRRHFTQKKNTLGLGVDPGVDPNPNPKPKSIQNLILYIVV